MTTASKALKALALYEGCNEWDEVINQFDIDEAATEAADPSNMSDITIFADGSRIVWDEVAGEWKIG